MQTNVRVMSPNVNAHHPDNAPKHLDLMQLASTIWRRKFPIIGCTVIVAAATAFVALQMAPVFQATTTLMVSEKNAKVVSFDPNTASDSNAANQYLESQFELMKSRTTADQVAQELGLAQYPEFDQSKHPSVKQHLKDWLLAHGVGGSWLKANEPAPTPEQLANNVTRQFQSRVNIAQLGKSQLVQIQVDMTDPVMAAKAANALAHAYMESQLQAAIGASGTASAWMNSRLGELGAKLKDSEERLQQYRDAENLVDVQGVSTVSAAQLSVTGEKMIEARRQRAEAESQYRQVQSNQGGGWEKLVSLPAVLADPLVQKFRAQQAEAQGKADELSRRYGPRHPAMEAANSDVAAATSSLKAQVEQVVASIQRNYQLAQANEGSLVSSFNSNKSQIQDISRKEFKLRELQREVDGDRALYETFATRLRETTATSDLGSASIRIVDPAITPMVPVRPNKPLIVALAAILTLILGSALALILEALNKTFKTIEQVESRLNVPVLGIVPKTKLNKKRHPGILFGDVAEQRFSESIRTIRTGVILNTIEKPEQVILITSSVPREGKSTFSINFAGAMGQLKKTLLVDIDLRRRSLAAMLGSPVNGVGLTDLVNGEASLEACIQSKDGFDFLSAGKQVHNPLEMLSSRAFLNTLKILKDRYDTIIIDSPPTHAVSDALVLSYFADSVIYVIKAASTSARLAEKGLDRLAQENAPLRGVVLNQVDIKKSLQNGGRFDGFYDYYDYSALPNPDKSTAKTI